MLRKLAFIILPTVEGRFVNANGAAKFRDAVSVLCYKFTNTLYYLGVYLVFLPFFAVLLLPSLEFMAYVVIVVIRRLYEVPRNLL